MLIGLSPDAVRLSLPGAQMFVVVVVFSVVVFLRQSFQVLGKDFQDELSGHFEKLCLYLLLPKPHFRAYCLHQAIEVHVYIQ